MGAKWLLVAAGVAATSAPAVAARADDRALCGRPGLDLACATVGTGFHVVPQKPASLRTFYVTMRPLPPASGVIAAPPFNVVCGGSGYTSVWATDSATGGPDGSVAFWSGTAKTAGLLASRGTIAVGTDDAANQSSYLDMSAGDGIAFAADRDIVVLGPRTTVEAYYDGRPFNSFQSVTGYAHHGATTRLVTNRPFVKRTVSAYAGTCFWWTGHDSVCLKRYQAKRPLAVYVDPTDAMRRVVEAGRSPAAARGVGPHLADVLRAQAGLKPTLY